MVEKILLLAVILALWAGAAGGETPPAAGMRTPPPPPPSGGQDGKGMVRLDEVRITGSAEHPGVLFSLPRPRFRLLPPGTDAEGTESFLRDDLGKGALQQ